LGFLARNPGRKKIETREDANAVAVVIEQQATYPIFSNESVTWNNERIDGSYGGYAVVNGSIDIYESGTYNEITSYTYNDVNIEYHDYCSGADFPTITGNATMTGSITCESTLSGNIYSGNWYLNGSTTLSSANCSEETWAYDCSVSFNFTYPNDYEYSGSIISDGKTWYVSY